MVERITIEPQPGFQERFLSSPADITIGGGSAGCGKSYAELLSVLPWLHLPGFRAVFLRRELAQIEKPGSVWDESHGIYRDFGGEPTKRPFLWSFPSGATVGFSGIELEDDKYKWQGSQIALLIFDELTHFTETQFWYMQSRNRSMCGIRPYTLATCNPDPDSWVAKLIAWWIDQETGFPIPERAGVLRYFTRYQDEMFWGDSAADVRAKLPDGAKVPDELIQSITFIPGKLEENQILEKADPTYRGKLMAMSRVERARLLDGNWKIRPAAGMMFRRDEVKILDFPPTDVREAVRRWDLAATEPSPENPDPDWTCGVKMGVTKAGRYVVLDVVYLRKRSNEVKQTVVKTAELDGKRVKVGVPQDPGQAGKEQAEKYSTEYLPGYRVWVDRETGDKVTRADPLAVQWQAHNVDIVRGPWNDWYLALMEAFPTKGVHDDPTDASSGAFAELAQGADIFRQFRRQPQS